MNKKQEKLSVDMKPAPEHVWVITQPFKRQSMYGEDEYATCAACGLLRNRTRENKNKEPWYVAFWRDISFSHSYKTDPGCWGAKNPE